LVQPRLQWPVQSEDSRLPARRTEIALPSALFVGLVSLDKLGNCWSVCNIDRVYVSYETTDQKSLTAAAEGPSLGVENGRCIFETQGHQNSLSTTHGKWCINCFRAANGTCRSLLNAAPELIAYAKANPVASYGTGTISQVAGELFKTRAGITMIHVPYRGGAPMVADLIGGQVQMALDVVAGSVSHIRSGSVRALAVTTATRLDALPDIPTVAETLPGYEAAAFTGIGVPNGTPEAIIERLNHLINAGLNDPGIKARLAELTVTPLVLSPAEFGAYMTTEAAKWARVIKLANIKAE